MPREVDRVRALEVGGQAQNLLMNGLCQMANPQKSTVEPATKSIAPKAPAPELVPEAEFLVAVSRGLNGQLRVVTISRDADQEPRKTSKGWQSRRAALVDYLRALEQLKQFVFGSRGMG